jgi:hypothetical protein
VELFAAIRRDARIEGASIRELADRYHVHRRTVRQPWSPGGLTPPHRYRRDALGDDLVRLCQVAVG